MPRKLTPAETADLDRRKADWDWLADVWRDAMRPEPAQTETRD